MAANEKIAAVGMGRMGRGIAITFAYAGLPVSLVDLKERTTDEYQALCDSASKEISATLTLLSEFGMLQVNEVERVLGLVRFYSAANSADALRNADVIFEGVPETLEAKTAALELICQHAPSSSLIASTTSTILSNELQALVTNPARFLNAHWLNPAFLVPLVEVSPGDKTDPVATEALTKLLERMGKVPVICSASPGYIVPRIQALAMNEAARMIEENVASVNDIDNATRYGFGFRFAVLGLLEFIDWGGGDILYHASRYMTKATGDDRHASPDIIAANMEQGRIGLSTKKGFLDYQGMDIPAYQKARLGEFIALLRHIDKLPVKGGSDSELQSSSTELVMTYLSSMEKRDLGAAKDCLSADFKMTFPGGVTFTQPEELVNWSKSRYRSISKNYEKFDECSSDCQANDKESTVYCYGTLQGEWPDGSEFNGIRFVDRFTLVHGRIVSQLVWNDLAEAAGQKHVE